jgi:hypothetical protein
MEYMLASHVVEEDAKVQFPMASALGVYLPSQQDVDGLNWVLCFTSQAEDV